MRHVARLVYFFFFQAEDGIRDLTVTGVQTCALPIFSRNSPEVALRIFALCTTVTLRRSWRRAYSNAYRTMRRQPSRVITDVAWARRRANGSGGGAGGGRGGGGRAGGGGGRKGQPRRGGCFRGEQWD